jgi:hypothetical protein
MAAVTLTHSKVGNCQYPAHIVANATANIFAVVYTVPTGVVIGSKASDTFASQAAAITAVNNWIAACQAAPSG